MVEARALVAQMSREEALGCLDGDLEAWPGLFGMVAGSYHRRTFPAAVVPRLGIPGIQFSDGPRGCVVGHATAFPVSMARGATWDPALEERIGSAIGAELRAIGATYYGGVCVNLLRHPGWGRAQETYGEDPHLVGEMGRALALGAQQHVMACVKHFAVNSMENARFKVDVRIDERALHEVYLPHFRRIIDSGIASVMSAYNSVNGEWCGENTELLTGILRDEWGFEGFVTSDFIFGLRNAVASVLAGLDIEMPFRQQRMQHLPGAVDDGSLPWVAVEQAVVRTVATLLRFAPICARPGDPTVTAGPAHRALAREAAAASIVLLRNDGVLPLDPAQLRRIAVIGRLATMVNLGDGGSSEVIVDDAVTPLTGLRAAFERHGIEVVHSDRDTSIAEDADVVLVVVGCTKADEGEYIDQAGTAGLLEGHFPPMTDADRAAVAEVMAGVDRSAAQAAPDAEPPDPTRAGFAPGGDRRSLRLSSDDSALVTAAAALNPRTIVTIMGGSATLVSEWDDQVAALLLLWYPGIEGGHALADVLLGTVNPGGHLPFSIPTHEAHLAHWDPDAAEETYDLWHGHWKLARDGRQAAYPFGFGLSYTEFTIDTLTLVDSGGDSDSDRYRDRALATVRVRNTGGVAGDVVIQIYGSVPGSAWDRPNERLVGFLRMQLAAGEARTAAIELDLRQLQIRDGRHWLQEGGTYRFQAGQFVGDTTGATAETQLDELRWAARS